MEYAKAHTELVKNDKTHLHHQTYLNFIKNSKNKNNILSIETEKDKEDDFSE